MLQYTIISGLMASLIMSHAPDISTELNTTYTEVSSALKQDRGNVSPVKFVNKTSSVTKYSGE